MPLLSMGHKEIGRTASSSIGKAMRKGAVVGIPGPPKRSDRISPAPRAPKPAFTGPPRLLQVLAMLVRALLRT